MRARALRPATTHDAAETHHAHVHDRRDRNRHLRGHQPRAEFAFELDAEAREMLLEGLDAIDLTLKSRGAIEAFLVYAAAYDT